MNIPKLFNAIKQDFPEAIAIGVCAIAPIRLVTKIKNKDVSDPAHYINRIEKKMRAALWEYDDADIELIIKLESLIYDWDISNTMNGLGACTSKSFLELYNGTENY